MKRKSFFDFLSIALLITLGLVFGFGVIFCFGGFRIPGCIFINRFGFYCPGCGATRAFIFLIYFEIVEAFRCNPFVPYTGIAILVYFVLYFLFKIKKFSEIGLERYCRIASYLGIGILIVNWIVRNLLLIIWNIEI